MRNLDFSSWQALLSTLLGLSVITLIGVGIRLIAMQTIQQRRERENRQINERVRTLIAAYKTLGGSFTGNLAVDPTHLRDIRLREAAALARTHGSLAAAENPSENSSTGSDALTSADRSRRVRDAVEGALSDIILLGTDEQVRLAATAANELAEGRPIHTAELVVSLRDFIRQVLDLDPVPRELQIPKQGPTRPSANRGKVEGGAKDDAKGGNARGGGGGGGGMGGGGFGGGGGGMGTHGTLDDDEHNHHQ